MKDKKKSILNAVANKNALKSPSVTKNLITKNLYYIIF